MDDNRIIERLFERDDTALDEIAKQYSRLYQGVLRGVLSDDGDIEECGNDLLLAVWNTVPPQRPVSLPAYLCRIARRIGIDRLRYNTRQMRSTEYTVTLSELSDCLPAAAADAAAQEDGEAIRLTLSRFLRELEPETQILFIRRYLYLESVTDLAQRFDLTENRISVKLYRARKKLKTLLEKEGILL